MKKRKRKRLPYRARPCGAPARGHNPIFCRKCWVWFDRAVRLMRLFSPVVGWAPSEMRSREALCGCEALLWPSHFHHPDDPDGQQDEGWPMTGSL